MTLAVINLAILAGWLVAELIPAIADILADLNDLN